ncbi:hypothetical protein [Streptomyces sp. PSKA30]|uniref:hypothetical protein n=1 Tax=Streptomyces sp. PSKA30 TaxID=2874597 RepID=UPI001CD071D9|nr:hypothetical protein [Streptomyces sp. PSKA30]MBZ9644313.1 hypothetical protein [Streptomyces sp. PSKA30]
MSVDSAVHEAAPNVITLPFDRRGWMACGADLTSNRVGELEEPEVQENLLGLLSKRSGDCCRRRTS